MARSRRPIRGNQDNIWPGFVDALSTLLLAIIFLLAIFVLAQFFLTQVLSGKDAALNKLQSQMQELSEMLALEKRTNADLRLNISQLSASLEAANNERDALLVRLDAADKRAREAQKALEKARQELADKDKIIDVDRKTLKARLAEVERLRRDIDSLKELRAKLESQIGDLRQVIAAREETIRQKDEDLKARQAEIGALRDTTKALEARLADERERTQLAQKEISDRETRLAELQSLYLKTEDDLANERKISAAAAAQVEALNAQMRELRAQLARIEAALEAAEARDKEKDVVIADLGKRLNQALASKVEELSRYRSEFFGRLREVLANRPGVRVVGDRFVFQSEVLFASGEAELGEQGKKQLEALAKTLVEIARTIPPELDWVLRVDGHTDKRPISTPRFPSNWELSAARAIAVVKFLIAHGIPPQRLVAAGFGQYQPLDPRDDEIAYRRNRRIELKLTQR